MQFSVVAVAYPACILPDFIPCLLESFVFRVNSQTLVEAKSEGMCSLYVEGIKEKEKKEKEKEGGEEKDGGKEGENKKEVGENNREEVT